MPKAKAIAPALMAVLALSAPAAAIREYARDTQETFHDHIKVSVGPWITSGMGRWQTSFPLRSDTPKSELGFGSTLEFQDPKNLLWLWTVEIRPVRRLSFEAQYADSNSIKGDGRDHDWLDSPNGIVTVLPSGNVYRTPHQTDMSMSQSSLSGRTTYMTGNVYGRVLQYQSRDIEDVVVHQYVDVILGFTVYDDRYRMKNLVQVISTGDLITTPPPGPYSGLDSTFHFHWQGFKLGMREETGFLESSLRAIGSVSFSPWVAYRGDGFWNLRPDFRSKAPNFTQSATATMIEGKATVAYSPIDYVTAELGYMFLYFHSNRGRITSYASDGSTSSQDLDSAWSERKGWVFTLGLQF